MRKALRIFGELTEQDIELLVGLGHDEEVTEGHALIREGEQAASIYVVLHGSLSDTKGRAEVVELARLYAGEIVGEMSFLDARPPGATVVARERTKLLAIPRPALQALLATNEGFAARFYRALGVLLATRLRSNGSRLAFGDADFLEEQSASEDDLELDDLAVVSRGRTRFDAILHHLDSK